MPELIKVYDTNKILLDKDTDYEIFKQFPGEVKAVDIEERTVTHLITTDARDRYGDIVEPKGAQVKNFLKNPVVLNAHDHWSFPVGTNLWIKQEGNGILAKTKFHDKTQVAIDAFNLIAEGVLRAWSIGFMPIDWETFEEDGIRGYRYKKWELLEYSPVTVPANPEALTMAIQKGLFVDPVWEKIIEKCEISSNQNSRADVEQFSELTKRIDGFDGRIKIIEGNMTAFESNAVEEANKKANESLEAIVEKIPELVGESLGGVVRRITGKTKGDI